MKTVAEPQNYPPILGAAIAAFAHGS